MVICDGIPKAVKYYRTIQAYLQETKSPFKAIVAFSGETDVEGIMMTESQLNEYLCAHHGVTLVHRPERPEHAGDSNHEPKTVVC